MFWAIALAVIAGLVVHWCWSESQSQVVLLPHGKAAFYRGGFFHRDKFDLVVFEGKWRFFRDGDLGQDELIVPFECPYNDSRTLLLEAGGKAYILDRKAMSREELRIVDGEWSYDATDHWQSIFDFDID